MNRVFVNEYIIRKIKVKINLQEMTLMKRKSENRILGAFLLNMFFAVFEFVGGKLTGSVAIASDALHDMGDAVGIGVSYLFERKSGRSAKRGDIAAAERYSAVGSVITASLLLLASAGVAVSAVMRILCPREIDYSGMLLLAAVGVAVNFLGALLTHRGESLNEKAVSLHMLEDVLGWAVTLVGAVLIKLTGVSVIDPIMSLGVASFISIHAVGIMKKALAVLRKSKKRADKSCKV